MEKKRGTIDMFRELRVSRFYARCKNASAFCPPAIIRRRLIRCVRCAQVSIVMEQTIRLLHQCGMPTEDMDFINCDGAVMHG